MQDEITAAISATLPGRIEAAQQELVTRKPPASMAAYECMLAAKVLHHRSRPEANDKALELVDRAIELDPDYAQCPRLAGLHHRAGDRRGLAGKPEHAGRRSVGDTRGGAG